MRFFFLFPLLFVLPAHAQPLTYTRLTSGTGFVVNREGHVITNAHVVQACQSISILTPEGELPATLVASDRERDLAVLKAPSFRGKAIAPLRWNIDGLRVGDAVIVMGFPGEEGSTGHSQFKKTTVTSLSGPTGEPNRIQLKSVARHGNSGGPVLDTSGNVIAVITGIALTYKVQPDGRIGREALGQSDFAITLPALQDFLRDYRIQSYKSSSGQIARADSVIQDNGHSFIVPVRCIQGTEQR
ncbi:MAG: serine protease [Pseudomonadota bacterium]